MAADISLNSAQMRQLTDIAKNALPHESCAFLLGCADSSEVIEIIPMTNADRSPYSFSIEPSELLRAYDMAEKKGLQVIGIFHSHPGKPAPSRTDAEFMELNPVVWLIFSTTEEKFGAFISEIGGGERIVDVVVRD